MKRFIVLTVLILTFISGFAFAEEAVTNPPTPPAAEQACLLSLLLHQWQRLQLLHPGLIQGILPG